MLKKDVNDIIREVKMSPNNLMLLVFTRFGTIDGFPQIVIFDANTRKKVN